MIADPNNNAGGDRKGDDEKDDENLNKKSCVKKGSPKKTTKDQEDSDKLKRRSSLSDSIVTSSSPSSADSVGDSDGDNNKEKMAESSKQVSLINAQEIAKGETDNALCCDNASEVSPSGRTGKGKKKKRKKSKRKNLPNANSAGDLPNSDNVNIDSNFKNQSNKTQGNGDGHKQASNDSWIKKNTNKEPDKNCQTSSDNPFSKLFVSDKSKQPSYTGPTYTTANQLPLTFTISSVNALSESNSNQTNFNQSVGNSTFSECNSTNGNSSVLCPPFLYSSINPPSSFGTGLSSGIRSSKNRTSIADENNSKNEPFEGNDEIIKPLETDEAMHLFAEQNKLIKKIRWNKWINQFHQSILCGDYQAFIRGFKLITVCLRRKDRRNFGNLTAESLASFVAKEIVQQFFNADEGSNILMTLLSNRGDPNNGCEQKNHGFCRIASDLMQFINDPSELSVLLSSQSKQSGKTALHFAATTGQPCQLRVLLVKSFPNPNIYDKSGRAALHYAIERNNLEMVKMLMWYGADLSLCQTDHQNLPPFQLCQDLYNSPNLMLSNWFTSRMRALEQKMVGYIEQVCSPWLKFQSGLSSTHFVRYYISGDNPNFKHRKFSLNIQQNTFTETNGVIPILYVFPVMFGNEDEYSAADQPIFGRTVMPNETTIQRISVELVEMDDGTIFSDHSLISVFTPLHNGYFYAFALPPSIKPGLYSISFSLRSSEIDNQNNSRFIFLAFKAAICSQTTNKEKRD